MERINAATKPEIPPWRADERAGGYPDSRRDAPVGPPATEYHGGFRLSASAPAGGRRAVPGATEKLPHPAIGAAQADCTAGAADGQ